jgi:hypothetical protein
MRANAITWLMVLTTATLAGCVGSDSSVSGDDQLEVASGPAGFSDTTGGLEGLVTDDQQTPLAGAKVGIGPSASQITKEIATSSAGFYSFSNLEPGRYVVVAVALGHESRAKSIEIQAGGVKRQDFELAGQKLAVPHSPTLILYGNIQCSVRAYPGVPLGVLVAPGWYTGVAVCNVAGIPTLPPDKFLLTWTLAENATRELLMEMTWDSTQALGRTLSVNLERTGHINDGTKIYGNAVGPDPLKIYANETTMAEVSASNGEASCMEVKCGLTTRVFAAANLTNLDWPTDPPSAPVFGPMHKRMVDFGFTLDQKFTQYLTSFHYQTMPAGFSALPDA